MSATRNYSSLPLCAGAELIETIRSTGEEMGQ